MTLETITSVFRTETSLLAVGNKYQLERVCSSHEIAICVQQRLMNASELDTSFKRFLSRFVKYNFRIRFKQCADGHYLVCETFWTLRRRPVEQIRKETEETASIIKLIYCHEDQSSEQQQKYRELENYISQQYTNNQCLDRVVMHQKLSSLTNSSREKTNDTYTYYSKIASLAIKAGDHNLSLHGGNQNPTENFENQEYIKLQSNTNQEVVNNDTAITNDMALKNAAVFYTIAIKAQKATHASTDIMDGNVVDWKKFAHAALSYDESVKSIQIISIYDMSNTENISRKREPLSDVCLEKLDTAIDCYTNAIEYALQNPQHQEDPIYQQLCLQRAEAQLCKAHADKRLSAMDGIALCNRVISFYNSRRDKERCAVSSSISVEDNNKFNNKLAFAYRTRGCFQYKDYQNYTYDADNCHFEKIQYHKRQKLRIYNDACESFNKSLSCTVEPSILRTTYCQMVVHQITACHHKDAIETCTNAIKALQDLGVAEPKLVFFYYHRASANFANLKNQNLAEHIGKVKNKSTNTQIVNLSHSEYRRHVNLINEIDQIVNISSESINDCTFAIGHSDDASISMQSLYMRGKFYCFLGRYQDAKNDFQRVLLLNNNMNSNLTADFYYHFGVAEYHTDCFDAAIEKFDAAFSRYPKNACLLDFYYYRANAYYDLQQLSLAKNDYDSVSSLLVELYITPKWYSNFYERRKFTLFTLNALRVEDQIVHC